MLPENTATGRSAVISLPVRSSPSPALDTWKTSPSFNLNWVGSPALVQRPASTSAAAPAAAGDGGAGTASRRSAGAPAPPRLPAGRARSSGVTAADTSSPGSARPSDVRRQQQRSRRARAASCRSSLWIWATVTGRLLTSRKPRPAYAGPPSAGLSADRQARRLSRRDGELDPEAPRLVPCVDVLHDTATSAVAGVGDEQARRPAWRRSRRCRPPPCRRGSPRTLVPCSLSAARSRRHAAAVAARAGRVVQSLDLSAPRRRRRPGPRCPSQTGSVQRRVRSSPPSSAVATVDHRRNPNSADAGEAASEN